MDVTGTAPGGGTPEAPRFPEGVGESRVTVRVSHFVRPGRSAEFEAALMGIINAAYRFPGHLGTSVFRPGDPSRSPYQVIFGFQSEADLRGWELSDERKRWLERLTSEAREDPREERISGLEAWFAQPDEPLPRTPPRYKTLAVTLLAAWPIITLLFLVFGPVLFRLPLLLRTAALSASMLSLMTYVVMPRMTRLFAPWLRGSSPSGPK